MSLGSDSCRLLLSLPFSNAEIGFFPLFFTALTVFMNNVYRCADHADVCPVPALQLVFENCFSLCHYCCHSHLLFPSMPCFLCSLLQLCTCLRCVTSCLSLLFPPVRCLYVFPSLTYLYEKIPVSMLTFYTCL